MEFDVQLNYKHYNLAVLTALSYLPTSKGLFTFMRFLRNTTTVLLYNYQY